jgi:tripartite-type tricarboxylate transporter receptor subunit TctC
MKTMAHYFSIIKSPWYVWARALLTGALWLLSGAVGAQTEFPNRSITFIVPQAAAGSTDTVARLTAQKLSDSFGRQVIVENRAGASGIIGADLVAKAPPNGYTLLVAGTGIIAINPFLYKNIAYDPFKSFMPIALIGYSNDVLVVHPGLAANTLSEVVALAKAKPGDIKYASAGVGTSPHLTAELFRQLTATELMHVPYKGSTPAVVATVSGETSMMFTGIASSIAHIKSGRLKAISVSSASRSTSLPDVPTIAESGYPGFEVNYWIGLFAPAGTPSEVVTQINDEINRFLDQPDTRARFQALGLEPFLGTPAQFASIIQKDTSLWKKTIETSGIKAE